MKRDGFNSFIFKLYSKIFLCQFLFTLEKIQSNRKVLKKAFTIQQTLKNISIILAMIMIQEILSMDHPLSIYLLKVNVDFASAMETVNNLSRLTEDMRINVQLKFYDFI